MYSARNHSDFQRKKFISATDRNGPQRAHAIHGNAVCASCMDLGRPVGAAMSPSGAISSGADPLPRSTGSRPSFLWSERMKDDG